MPISYTVRDFHWLSTACVSLKLDENRASLKPTLHDQTLYGDVTVCRFPYQLIIHHVFIIMTVVECGSEPLNSTVFIDNQ